MPTAVKKVAAKKTTKPVATRTVAPKAKKVASKKTAAGKALVYAPNEQSFWVHDGQILNSLKALHDSLTAMEKAVYTHHVGKGKHDFADWVEAVLGDSACAADLRKAKTTTTAAAVVAKHLRAYSF